MNHLKKIILVIAVVILEQSSSYAMSQQSQSRNQNYSYNKNINHADAQAAARLTDESYITPEMQWAVLSYLGNKGVTINTITGAAQDIPSVDVILNQINQRLDNRYTKPIQYAEKESIKNALLALLEATDLASFVAAVEAAYRDQIYTFYQNVDAQLTAKLTEQKTRIQNVLTAVNALTPADQPSSIGSYFSWFTGSSTTNTTQNSYIQPLVFDTNAEMITIPGDLMQAIIAKNDYKKEPTGLQAANLLFKECFIAQQHHLKDSLWIDQITIHLESPLTPDNYIFTQFPDVAHMCDIAKNLVMYGPARTSLQASVSQEQMAAHQLLLHVRQAIQTAMYIANAKSSYNISYILPTAVVSYLGGIVNQLLVYDAQLSALCKDPLYGATPEDTYRDEKWSAITKIATGAITLAAIAGTFYIAAPAATISALTNVGSLATSTVGSVASGTANLASNLWGTNKDGTAYSNWQQTKAITDTVGTAGQIALAYGAGTSFVAAGAQALDKAGYISLDQLHPQARAVVDTIYNTGLKTSAVAAPLAAIGALGSAIDTTYNAATIVADSNQGLLRGINPQTKESEIGSGRLYNAGKTVWHTTSAGASGTIATLSTVSLASKLASAANNQASQNKQMPQQQYSQRTQQNSSQLPEGQFPPELIATAFTRMINNAPTEGFNPIEKIKNASMIYLENGKITLPSLHTALQAVQQSSGQNNPEVAQQLGQLIQGVEQAMQQKPQQ